VARDREDGSEVKSWRESSLATWRSTASGSCGFEIAGSCDAPSRPLVDTDGARPIGGETSPFVRRSRE
jgi:hypothetical protein